MYIDIDISKEPPKPKLSLAKPNKEIIGNLTNVCSVKRLSLRLGDTNELTFEMPIETDVRGTLVRNKYVDIIKERHLVKLQLDNYSEWYLIHKIDKVMDDSGDYNIYHCRSLNFELADKIIKDYSVISKRASEVLRDALQNTNWSIGYIDSEFDIKFRSFDVSTTSVLDFIYEVAEAFNALVVWDTHERKVSFYKLSNYGHDKGLKIKYGKLMDSITYEKNTDEFCTRLRVFGKDGISINSVNPTGANFIEDYSYFMHPFERDENKNVISHSDFMSDELCHALLDYKELVESKRGQFEGLLSDLTDKQSELTAKQTELYHLNTELNQIEDAISVANATGQNPSSLIAQKNVKLSEINAKQNEINNVQRQIDNIMDQIEDLREEISVENNFSKELLEEWNYYIVEREWTNTNFDDPKELYEAALEEFEKSREPKIVAKVDIVNLFEMIEEQKNWGKLNLGDFVTIEHEKLRVRIKAKIMEIQFDFDSGDIDVTISNLIDLITDEQRVLKDLRKAISSSATFNSKKYEYDKSSLIASEVYQAINNTWSAIERKIVASNNETVEIGRKGILISSIDDPQKMIILQHGVIALSNDGANTWKTAITPDYIVAERLAGVILAGVNLHIDASTPDGTRTFTVDEKGVLINGATLKITGGSNGVEIGGDDGIVVTRTDNRARVIMNATKGIAVQTRSSTSGNWRDRFFVDQEGNIVAATLKLTEPSINAGHIEGTSINVNNRFMVDSNGNMTANNATISGNIIMNGGSINWSTVNSDPVATNAYSTASSALSTANGAVNIAQAIVNGTYKGGTFIDGQRVIAPEIYGGLIEGGRIIGGEILSNSKIQVTTDIELGNNLILRGDRTQNKSIVFYGVGNLTFKADGKVELAAFNSINLSAAGVDSPAVFANGQQLATQNWVRQNAIARFG